MAPKIPKPKMTVARSLIEPKSPRTKRTWGRVTNGLIKAIAVASVYLSIVQFPVQASICPIGLPEDIRVAISSDENESVSSCINGTNLFFGEDHFGRNTIRTFLPESRSGRRWVVVKTSRDVYVYKTIWSHGKDWIKCSAIDRRVPDVLVVQSDRQGLAFLWSADIAKLYHNIRPELRPFLIVGDRKLAPSNPENAESYDSVYTHADSD